MAMSPMAMAPTMMGRKLQQAMVSVFPVWTDLRFEHSCTQIVSYGLMRQPDATSTLAQGGMGMAMSPMAMAPMAMAPTMMGRKLQQAMVSAVFL